MIITRYLSKDVLSTCMAITLLLLMVFLSQQLVRYLNYAVVGKIPTNVLLLLVGFEVPYLLSFLLPLGLYLAMVIVFGRLYSDNEMAILNLYGFGSGSLLRYSFMLSSVIALVVLYLMLSINPWLSSKRQAVMESNEATAHLVETLIPGRFQLSPDGKRVMYVQTLSVDRLRAQNVFLAQDKGLITDKNTISNQPWMLVFARQGYQAQDRLTHEPLFVTTDGYRYEGKPGQNDFKIIQFEKYTVRLPKMSSRLAHQDVEALPLSALLRDYHIPKLSAECQWRFSLPLVALILGLLAVPVSYIRPRQGRYRAVLPAILVYIIYINLLFVAKRWLEQGMVPVTLGLWWVHGIMMLLVLFLYFWQRHG